MRFALRVVLVALLLDQATSPARAQVLYGVTFPPGPELITINTTTGAGTPVGSLGPVFPNGLAFRGTKLYVWDVDFRIKELNPATGAVMNTIDIGSSSLGEGDIVFRSDGIGFLNDWQNAFGPPKRLTRFDVTVPSSTVVGTLSQQIDGLAFNSAGVLYGLEELGGRLYTIDTATAALTLVGSTGITKFVSNALGGLAFDASDNLYAVLCAYPPAGPSELYSINPATGTATLIGNIGFNGVCGIRFGAPPPPGVTVTQSAGATNIAEGGATDTYTVVLNSAPTANVTITLSAGTQATVAPATLTFTPANWNSAQTVTVTAVDDALVEGPHTATITHTAVSTDAGYNGIAVASVTVNITDNEVGPLPGPPAGGGEGSYAGSNGVGPQSEGEFGFGARMRSPRLLGPVPHGPSDLRVFNVAHRSRMQAALPGEERHVPVWSIAVTGLVLALVVSYVASLRLR